MESFEAAAEYLHVKLGELRSRGARLYASRETLLRVHERGGETFGGSSAVEESPVAFFGKTEPGEKTSHRVEGIAPGASPLQRPDPAIAAPLAPLGFEAPNAVARSVAALGEKQKLLDELRQRTLACTKCPALVKFRHNVVFGVGDPDTELMFVGEAPGEEEDLRGEPFVGKAGQLLTRVIETMGYQRSSVYIANILKCRPDMPPNTSGNRKPTPAEMSTCAPYLLEQIKIIQPRAIVALGLTAVEGLIGTDQPMNRLRGRWHEFAGTPLMPTYHPAYLLRNQSLGEKRKLWEDMLLVLEKLGKPITDKQRGFFLQK